MFAESAQVFSVTGRHVIDAQEGGCGGQMELALPDSVLFAENQEHRHQGVVDRLPVLGLHGVDDDGHPGHHRRPRQGLVGLLLEIVLDQGRGRLQFAFSMTLAVAKYDE
jgi:hypothetical protein